LAGPVSAGPVPTGRLVLLRHGETEWSRSGRHTGVTDVPLTPAGEKRAAGLAETLGTRRFVLVATSPRIRARRTADLAGLRTLADGGAGTVARREVWPELAEWDYGAYEGRTSVEINREVPGWTIWTGPVPGGEKAAEVGARADAVIAKVLPVLAEGDAALVGHGHMLRVLIARWLGLAPESGSYFVLEPAGVTELGYEHSYRCVRRLNA
jgi:broad specificity phosphatase PhoE